MTWIKPQHAAQLLHLHPDTLARKVDAGEIPIATNRSEAGHRRYWLADVERAAKGPSMFSHALIEELAPQLAETIEDYLGLIVPMSAIDELFAEQWGMLGEFKQYGNDTDIRQMILDTVAEDLAGRGAPTFGDGDRAYHIWRQRLERAALEREWQITTKPEDLTIDWTTAELPAGERERSGPPIVHLIKNKISAPQSDVALKVYFGVGFDPQAPEGPDAADPEQIFSMSTIDEQGYDLTVRHYPTGAKPAWIEWLEDHPNATLKMIKTAEQHDAELQMIKHCAEEVASQNAFVVMSDEHLGWQYYAFCRVQTLDDGSTHLVHQHGLIGRPQGMYNVELAAGRIHLVGYTPKSLSSFLAP